MGQQVLFKRKVALHTVSHPGLTSQEPDEFIVAEVVEYKDVKCMWSDEIYKNGGWLAKSEDGRIFKCNWSTYPSDSMSPYWNWGEFHEDGTFLKLWYNMNQGLRDIPCCPKYLKDNGFDLCEIHDDIFNVEAGCYGCKNNWKPADRPERNTWKGWR